MTIVDRRTTEKRGALVAEPIAIVGVAGRFPESLDVDAYWENLVAGRDCIAHLDDDDLRARGEDPGYLAHPDYVRRRPRMPEVENFDPRCFGMTPREAEIRDPQHRVLLELCDTALERAGYDSRRYPGAIGVFAGSNVQRYRIDHLEKAGIEESVGFLQLEISNAPDYVATFIAHRLGLRGPAMTVQSACSTTLTAIHTACRSLQARDCDMALAGVASIEFPLDYGYIAVDGSILSHDGVVRPFDAKADGTNFGSGAGVVLLKRLPDALSDRDTILAVIRGSALNNDGNRKDGFTAPSAIGQAECIVEAIRSSGVHPRDISYVEAHGTGTSVGDPIEVSSLAASFQQAAGEEELPAGYCLLGSVKGNVGHMGQAAGASGVIKTVLALQHELIPASINVDVVNPKLNLDATPFKVCTEAQPWPYVEGHPRRAGVSSFGIGGTNGHLVLEEAPTVAPRPELVIRDGELLTWSAAERKALDAYAPRLAEHFATGMSAEAFQDAAHTLRVGRMERRLRRAVVASDAADAADRLGDPGKILTPDGIARSLVFCFPGQGAQYPGVASGLYRDEPEFRRHCDESFELLRPILGRDLGELWRTCTEPAELSETEVAQPLIYVLELAMAHLLDQLGLRPDRVVGHSVGEIAAATVAGVLSREDGLRVIAARSRFMQSMPRGGMLAVAAAVDQLDPYLRDGVTVAAVNGSRQVVLSGSVPLLEAVAARLRADDILSHRLGSSHAFHSPMMESAAAAFEEMLANVVLSAPAIPLVSCATGELLTDEQAVDPRFWARQLVDPVLFSSAVATLQSSGPALLVEVGPGHTLASLMRSDGNVRGSSSVVLTTTGPASVPAWDRHDLLETLGRLWVEGLDVDLAARDRGLALRRVPLPGYPYQRRRLWIERDPNHKPTRDNALRATQTDVALAAPATQDAPVEVTEVATAVVPVPSTPEREPDWSLGTQEWVRVADGAGPYPAERVDTRTALLVLPDSTDAATSVRRAFQRAGYRTRCATAGTGGGGRLVGPALDTADDAAWDAFLTAGVEGDGPYDVVYAVPVTGPAGVGPDDLDAQVEQTYFAVVSAAQAVARAQRRSRRDVRLVVLARHATDVSGSDPVNPVTAMLDGLLRTVEDEFTGLRTHLVDVAPGTRDDTLADALSALDEPFVALRGAARWLPRLRAVERAPLPGHPRLRQRGVYLVTGGLGGLGLVVARALADTGIEPRIALLTRSGAPAADSWRGAEILAALQDLEDAGAEVLVVRGDVADADSLESAVAVVEERLGTIQGVVHSAGVAGGGLIARRTREEVAQVFAPKLRGTLNIESVFSSRPALDLLVLFSSQASLTGMLGSADYSAANGFLNAHASAAGRGSRWTVSVAWPGWSGVGMLARTGSGVAELLTGAGVPATPDVRAASGSEVSGADDASQRGAQAYRTELDPAKAWELREHRFGDRSVLPGTGSLELVLKASLELDLLGSGPDGSPAPIEIRDAVFVAPVEAAGPIELSVAFTRMADVFRFRVQSRPAGTERPWVHHVNGVVAPVAERPDAVDLADVVSGMTEVEVAPFESWITFGPRWNCLDRLRRSPGAYLATLSLGPDFLEDLEQHPMHPALLDRASMSFSPEDTDSAGGTFLPFLYRSVRFFGPLPRSVAVHARMQPEHPRGVRIIDMDLCDPATGDVCVEVRGYTIREVDPAEFQRRLEARPAVEAPSRRLLEGARIGVPGTVAASAVAPASTSAEPDGRLLSPGEGAEAFLEVLDGRLPSLVVVSPRSGPLQVDGTPWIVEHGTGPQAATIVASPPQPAVLQVGATTASAASTVPAATAGTLAVPAASTVMTRESILAGLRELWTEALGIDDIGDDEDFFEIGGNSLVAVQLTARLRERFSVDLGGAALFDANTVGRLTDTVLAMKG